MKGVAVVAVLAACLTGWGLWNAWHVIAPPEPETMTLHLSQAGGVRQAQSLAQLCGQSVDGVRFVCVP